LCLLAGASRWRLSTLQGQVSTLQTDDATLTGEVSALNATLSKVSYNPLGLNGKPTLTITGANLQIISGSGHTDATPNGLGNLIIGYDESPGVQTGSHNLMLGQYQAFTSYGGLIAGRSNTLSGPFSDVFGEQNTASGPFTSVSGGFNDTASGNGASVSGGDYNTASSLTASVSGGESNTASGELSSVSGGYSNTASGFASSVLGGVNNNMSTTYGHTP
jgi:hypothetical protein